MKKVTYTLDEGTVEAIREISARTGRPQSSVVREAMAAYSVRNDRVSESERRRRLAVLDAYMATKPKRSPAAVDRELREIRASRRAAASRRDARLNRLKRSRRSR